MKFSCERCGKKYATAETPTPGKVYKLKCKACGHLIVVRAASSAPSAPPPPVPAWVAPPASTPPALPSSPEAGSKPPPFAAARAEAALPASEEPPPPANGASRGVPELPSDAAAGLEIDATPPPAPADYIIEPLAPPPAAPPGEELRPTPTPSPEEELQPPAGEGGYVDLFSDLTPDAKDLAPSKHDDPFLRAAPGLGTAVSAPDPFAAPEEPVAAAQPAPVPKIPEIPKPPPHRSGMPIALIAAGVAVLVGILAFVLLGSAKRSPTAAAPSPAQPVQAQAPPPAAPPVTPPAAEPPKAEVPAPAPPPVEGQPATEPPRPPEKASEDGGRRGERKRGEREQAARDRERRAREERDAAARERAARRDAAERSRRDRERLAAAAARQEGDGTLTEPQIESVIRSTKKAFDSCLQHARGTDSTLDGRRVMLRLNIQPSGTVTYPTLDDVTLNATDLGSCLKSAARLMVFPKFKGETMHVEVPLVMR